ncbi:FUSC family protein, partial [Pseudoalteromonas ruthenica]
PDLTTLMHNMSDVLCNIAKSNSFQYCADEVKAYRKRLTALKANNQTDSPFESHMLSLALEIASELTILLKAYKALEERDQSLLNAP